MRRSGAAGRILWILLCLALLTACGAKPAADSPAEEPETEVSDPAEEQETAAEEQPEKEETTEETEMLHMWIGETAVAVEWEDNESVAALKDLCRNGELTIDMSMYGGFEQVGSIGSSLPRSDVQTTTSAGDIVLYSGNQMVVFYGANSWAYTRLGHITDRSAAEMEELLGHGNVTITLSMEGER